MAEYVMTGLYEFGDAEEHYHVSFANGRNNCEVYLASSFAEVERFLRNRVGVSDDANHSANAPAPTLVANRNADTNGNGGVPAVANGDQNQSRKPIGVSIFKDKIICLFFGNPGEILREALLFEKNIIPSKDPFSKNLLQTLLSGEWVKVVFDPVSVERFFQHDVRYDIKNGVDLEEESTVQLLVAKKKKRIPFFQTSERNLKYEILLSELIGLRQIRIPILAEKSSKLHLQEKTARGGVNQELVMKLILEAFVSFEVGRRIRIPVNEW